MSTREIQEEPLGIDCWPASPGCPGWVVADYAGAYRLPQQVFNY
jgi:hypothetical protein